MRPKQKHADDLIDTLIDAIEADNAPWARPWKCDDRLASNLVTGQQYHGRNLLMLVTPGTRKGYTDHRWAGFQQIKAAGGHVRRGEHGEWICIMREVRGSKTRRREDDDLEMALHGRETAKA